MKSLSDYRWPLMNPNHKPFAHQVEGVKFHLAHPRSYNLSDIGTGKTLMALWAADILIELGVAKKVLVATPLSTVQVVWGYELFTNFPHRYYAIAHGSREERRRAITSEAHFVIINHDGVNICELELIAQKFDLIIIDEMTAYKNAQTDKNKAMRRIAPKAKGVIGMTGLPTPNSPTEAYGQAKVVNPKNPLLPVYYTQFRDMVVQQVAQGVFVPKPNSSDIVHQVLQPAVRFTRDECLDIPPVFHQHLELDMTPEQKELYERMRKQLYIEYEAGAITAVNAGVKLNKLLQIAAGAVINDDGNVLICDAINKINMIIQTFEELGRTKLIVAAAYKAVVERLCSLLQGKGIDCQYIHGGIGQKVRTQYLNDFQYGSLGMLIMQPECVAHGITLTATSTIVWQSMVASGETYEQFNGRITRAGQDKKQYVKHLISCSAERRIVNILEGKTDLSHEVLNLFANQEI